MHTHYNLMKKGSLDTKPPIFNIAKGAEASRLRVGVSSKVNFSKLSPKEQLQRFRNQAQEIKELRHRLSKKMLMKSKKQVSDIQKAIDKVKSQNYELDDQKFLVENLVKGICKGVIVPNTLAYNQICTILREVLSTTVREAKYNIKLDRIEVPISQLEYETYSKLPFTPGALQTFIGKEQTHIECSGELLRKLNLQAFAKAMSIEMGLALV